MVEAARVLDSKVISGNIITQSNEGEIALNYNSGGQLILIEKLKGMGFVNIGSIKSAEIITSKFGIILKDAGSNSIFLLANNDAESIKMFERIKLQWLQIDNPWPVYTVRDSVFTRVH